MGRIFSELQSFVNEIGLWEDPRRRFLLPASVHRIEESDVQFFNELGPRVVNFLKVSDEIMKNVVEKNINNGPMKMFRKAATVGIAKERKKIRWELDSFPGTVKVDFVKGVDGKMHIVEIDTVNTHGLGYGVILRQLSDLLSGKKSPVKGTKEILNHSDLEVIVAFNDRFHEGEWESTSRLVDTLSFHQEKKVSPENFVGKTILDIHHKLDKSFQDGLTKLCKKGDVKILVPPKDQLGSKNLLAFLWNQKTAEVLIDSGLSIEDLNFIKKHLPETLFVDKNNICDLSDDAWLLKDVNSNAMKGVKNPSEVNFNKIGNCNFIAQRKVEQKEQEFSFFDEDGRQSEKNLFSRYIVYFDEKGTPLDCLFTATDKELTHGGVDAVMGACWS